jgi:molybdopterin-guanine dinucleotide biosynthesis protein A
MKKQPRKGTGVLRANGGFFGGLRLNAEGYILVGGASSRFGADKALAELDGLPMYARMADLLKTLPIVGVLVGDPAKYNNLGLSCTDDEWPGEGPLGGIVTSLRRTEAASLADYNLIVSCDMPFLTAKWLEYLLTIAGKSEADVVLAKSGHGLEPLCAVWRTAARSAIELQFKQGVRKVTQAIGNLKSEVLDEAHWKRFDSAGRLFWNMNTPEDYREAQRIVKSERTWWIQRTLKI